MNGAVRVTRASYGMRFTATSILSRLQFVSSRCWSTATNGIVAKNLRGVKCGAAPYVVATATTTSTGNSDAEPVYEITGELLGIWSPVDVVLVFQLNVYLYKSGSKLSCSTSELRAQNVATRRKRLHYDSKLYPAGFEPATSALKAHVCSSC
jgi:hypothetical protein